MRERREGWGEEEEREEERMGRRVRENARRRHGEGTRAGCRRRKRMEIGNWWRLTPECCQQLLPGATKTNLHDRMCNSG